MTAIRFAISDVLLVKQLCIFAITDHHGKPWPADVADAAAGESC